MGAAVILPIYFYLSLKNQPIETESWISLWNAKPLTLSLVIGSLVPGLAEITAVVLPRSGLVHQHVIAFMQMSPLVMSAVQYIVSGLYPIRNIDVRTRKSAYIPSVQQALLVAGAFSAISHAIVLGNILLGNQSIRSIYMPDSTAVRLAHEGQKLLEGSRLFLQYDYIGIFLSIVLWCNHLITSITRVSNIKLTALLATASLLAGPAAVGCAVLSWREQEMLQRREHARKMRQSQKA